MGNAESGPEIVSPRGKDGNSLFIASSPLVYSGGRARAVTSRASKLEEDMRQPNPTHHVKLEEAGREIHDGDSKASRHLASHRNQVVRPPVTFHTIPLEMIVESSNASSTEKDWDHTPDVEMKNSIVQTGSDIGENEFKDEGEISKLYRKIANLGTDVIEATAAVYHYLETKSLDDEMTVVGRSNTVLRYIKKAAERGNTQPAYKFLETAKAVAEVLDDQELEDDDDSNPAMIRMLKDADEQQSVSDRSFALTRLLEETGSLNGGGSVFRILDEDEVIHHPIDHCKYNSKNEPAGINIWDPDDFGCDDDCFPTELLPSCSPRTQATLKAGKSRKSGTDLEYFSDKYVPEAKSTAEESEDGPKWTTKDLNSYRQEAEYYPNGGRISSSFGSQLDLTDLPHMHAIDANMDLEFVEHFDNAFNDFLAAHPQFVTDHPDVVHNLRILKLQQLLEHNDALERDLTAKIESAQSTKEHMEENMQSQLKEAARKKAARQTFLQSELNNLSWSTKRVQAQLRWKILQYSVDRAKRQFKMRQQFKAIPEANTRQDLVSFIPDGVEGSLLKDVVQESLKAQGSKPYMLSAKQEDQLREYQSGNSVMSAELSMLTKKLTDLQMEAKKYAWVESILLRLDEGTMLKLKSKFQKKEGVAKL
ncbi:hypothetical protein IV203_037282 [Nitzschia inconspicua]|uniref:Uncharacterized protein n=1 Tax=Nitzschia inconspicua TaxID=303405 RepID=A0A9K3LLL8_9STRA|nr:hypothetical protein IV203_037282 [Nitzschia inconspicua]